MKKAMAKSDVNKKSPVTAKIIWVIVIIQMIAIGWLVTKQATQKSYKIAYVEISKVYDEFSLTKKLNEDFKKMQTAKQAQLDTFKLKIERMEMEINAGNKNLDPQYVSMKEQYLSLEDQMNNDNLIVQNKYLEQISTQLNALVKEYGEKNNYDIIFGANGEGGIMHGNEALNITTEVTEYINKSSEQ